MAQRKTQKLLLQICQFRCLRGNICLLLHGQISQIWRGLAHAILFQKQGSLGIPKRYKCQQNMISSKHLGPPCLLGHRPINPFHHHHKLRAAQGNLTFLS